MAIVQRWSPSSHLQPAIDLYRRRLLVYLRVSTYLGVGFYREIVRFGLIQ